jgi:ParB family chromosome partitioning protein
VLLAVENRDELIALAQTMIREGWSVRKAERYLSRKERDRAQQTGDKQVTDSSGPDREVVRIEEALRYALGTEVHLFHGEEAGKIEIHYAGREELERILDLLGIQIH